MVWSLYALVVSELTSNLPIFQVLFLMFSVSFCAMALRITLLKRWCTLRQPWFIWVIGIVGVCGSDVAYVMAVKYAPPAHVDFIDYLWPFFVILFSGLFTKERLSLPHFIAGILGLFGVFLLLTGGEGLLGLNRDYMVGYVLALLAALIWSLYTIIVGRYKGMPVEMVGIFCGVGALVCFALHHHFEVWVMPTWLEMVMIFLLGLSSGIAYLLWGYAIQNGNIKLLSVLAYFTPVISMSLLVLSGKQPFSTALVLSCILVASGVVVGSVNWVRVMHRL